jgi:hypothetical protein
MPGLVLNPVNAKLGDGTQQPNNVYGVQGEQLDADIHGTYWNAAVRKNVYRFMQDSVVLPTVAATAASKFALYNPTGSGVIAEILFTDIGQDVATEVVNIYGWYASWGATAQANLTVLTAGVALTDVVSARVGDTPAPQVIAYKAITYTVIPVLVDIVEAMGATTITQMAVLSKAHNGTLLLPPGGLISLLCSTTAEGAGANSAAVTWAEWPYL